jgi:hypothetical protein
VSIVVTIPAADNAELRDVETIVTLALRDLGQTTELEMSHGVFATERRRAARSGLD